MFTLCVCMCACVCLWVPSSSSGRKKSKLKILKSRLFRKSKKAGDGGMSKLSQSTSDITAGKGLGSEEDLA